MKLSRSTDGDEADGGAWLISHEVGESMRDELSSSSPTLGAIFVTELSTRKPETSNKSVKSKSVSFIMVDNKVKNDF